MICTTCLNNRSYKTAFSNFKKEIVSILAIIVFCNKVFAQTELLIPVMDSVIITSLRTNDESVNIPYSVSTIDASYFNKVNSRTTPELLSAVNGLFIQKTNHGGGSPFIRGLTGNQTLVLVDGIRLNNAIFRYGPNQYTNTIDPFTIQNIEVVKGTGSVQYGSDAIGGIINILTKKPTFSKDKNHTTGNAVARYVTGDMEKTVRLSGTHHTQKSAIQAGLSLRNFGDLIGGDTTNKQTPSGYKEMAFDVKAVFVLSSKMVLQMAHQHVIQYNVPVYHKVVLENFKSNKTERQKRFFDYAKLEIVGNRTWLKQVDVTLSHQQGHEQRSSIKNGSNTQVKEQDKITTAGFTVNALSQIKKDYAVNTGVELYHDWVKSTRADVNLQTGFANAKRGLYPNNSRYSNLSFYSLHNIKHKNFVLNAGLRLNSFAITVKDTFAEKTKLTPKALVVNAGILYSISKRHKLYSNYSTGFRAPNIDDLGTLGIVDFRYEIPTASLAPEKSANYEVGYKFKTNTTKVEVALYYMQLYNLITRNKIPNEFISGYQVYSKQNAEKAFIKGFEVEVQQGIGKFLKLTAATAYAYGKNTSRQEPIRRIPPLNARLVSSFSKNRFFINGEFIIAAKQDRLAQGDISDNRIPKGGTPAWQVFNIFGGYQISFLQLNVGLQNITNEDYRTHGSGINAVGRSIVVSAAVDF